MHGEKIIGIFPILDVAMLKYFLEYFVIFAIYPTLYDNY